MPEGKFLYEELDILNKHQKISNELPDIIQKGLATRISLREYQIDAFRYFISNFEEKQKTNQIHNLFHMATGSGKTVIMAGLILYLYTKGYRKFLFFVNQTNILEKTIDNFTNRLSSKYLFNDIIEYAGNKVQIKRVNNFSSNTLYNDIEILFTSTQKLHLDLFEAKENSITYDDFESNEIVFISDESHHINTLTRRPNRDDREQETSWEYSVMNAFSRNKNNILLEFTATCDLRDNNVLQRYKDKIVFNYPLKEFRESGYTKDFQNFAINSDDLWIRTLIALVMSEYRKFLFADLNLNIKPVIMLKSQRIAESEEFYGEFLKKMETLSTDDISNLKSLNIDILNEAISYFEEKDSELNLLKASIQSSFTENNSIIMNGASDSNKEKQLLVNSLEDEKNPIRLIFAVDMLNEGWDVLNLFDIVRLYDTRQGSGKAGKVGAYTIKEAQLIGRAARYCPFVDKETNEELKFKRKYDEDLSNKNRILETMYFHSKNDSNYISELKRALIATGLQAEAPIEIEYKLKSKFTDSDFYKKTYVFANKRIAKGRADIKGIEESMRSKTYDYNASNTANIIDLFGDEIRTNNTNVEQKRKTIKFKDIDSNILLGASEYFDEFRFDILKEKYPTLSSKKEFFTSDKFIGNSQLEITYSSDELSGRTIFLALKSALSKISTHIFSLKEESIGSKDFEPKQLSAILKDKKIYMNEIAANGGKGDSQNDCTNEHYKIDLSKKDWYVFNDNYGTSEEKLFIKYFDSQIAPKLDKKDLDYYVIRNERVAELAIYSFETGERFEPDFLLFIRKEGLDTSHQTYQGYVEPKGNLLLDADKWKEDFLLELGANAKPTDSSSKDYKKDYKIIGLPFFNQDNRLKEFEDAIDNLIKNI